LSIAYILSCNPSGRAILAANDYAIALRISAKVLRTTVTKEGHHAGSSVESNLKSLPGGLPILNAITNNIMLILYSAKNKRIGAHAPIKKLPTELLNNVLTMLDGREPNKNNKKLRA
jgi:hypothetical protein